MVDTKQMTEHIYDLLKDIGTVTLSQPTASTQTPIIVIAPPVETGYPHQQYYILRFTVEAWNDTRYKCMQTFDSVKTTLTANDINLRTSTGIYQDVITQKYRITGNFECRYNCITNKIEQNF